jgi:hypothetical protein
MRRIGNGKAQAALLELWWKAKDEAKWFPWSRGESQLFSTIAYVSKRIGMQEICIDSSGTISKFQGLFTVDKRPFRIDVENIRGCNFGPP